MYKEVDKQGKKRGAYFLVLFACLFFLAACSSAANIVCQLDKEAITVSDLLQQDAIYGKLDEEERMARESSSQEGEQSEGGKAASQALLDRLASYSKNEPERGEGEKRRLERRKKVLQLMAVDALIRADEDLPPLEAEKEKNQMKEELLASYGGEEGIKKQLAAYGLEGNELNSLLESRALEENHRQLFEGRYPLQSEEVRAYYDKHKEKAAVLSFQAFYLPRKSEAVKAVKELREDPAAFEDYMEKYRHDLLEKTGVLEVEGAGPASSAVFDADLYQMKEGEVDYFYHDGLYYVVYMQKKASDFVEVAEALKGPAMDEKYLNYLNQLAKKHRLRFYEKNIPSGE